MTTGGGNDSVVTGGVPGDPDHDAIDLGPGDDEVELEGPVDPAYSIDGGSGSDEIEFGRSTMRRAWAIDNSAGQATHAGEPVVTWSGFETFQLLPWSGWVAPSFIGGDGAETVYTVVPLTSVDLGDGNDRVNLDLHTRRLVDHASYFGGAGIDTLTSTLAPATSRDASTWTWSAGICCSVRTRSRSALGSRSSSGTGCRRGASTSRAHRRRSRCCGSACRGVVAGGPGDDVLESIAPADVGCGYLGEDAEAVARGGRGDDTLVGEYMPDILIGGRGNDLANGRRNVDRCVAETEIRCDR